MYSQTSVTVKAKAAYHSIHLGAPEATPFSIKSKSRTRLRAAIPTTTRLKAMPIGPLPLMSGIAVWKNSWSTMLTK